MQIATLSTTPVKGFALHHPQSIEVNERGVTGDREFFLVDDAGVMFSTSKTGELPGFSSSFDASAMTLSIYENGTLLIEDEVHLGELASGNFFSIREVQGHLVPGPWEQLFSERLGRAVKMIKAGPDRSGTDVGRLSIISSGSVQALQESAHLTDLDPRRFRMNIEISGIAAHEEDTWFNQEFKVGTAVLRGGGPVQRCVATTRNPDTGVVDLKVLKLIRDYRGRQESEFGLGFNFGVYGYCMTPGTISVGDEVSPLTT
jgi:uncharacterized protein